MRAADASRPAVVLVGCSLLAPCGAGASTPSVRDRLYDRDPTTLARNARRIRAALAPERFESSGYVPVTRDLSTGKRRLLFVGSPAWRRHRPRRRDEAVGDEGIGDRVFRVVDAVEHSRQARHQGPLPDPSFGSVAQRVATNTLRSTGTDTM